MTMRRPLPLSLKTAFSFVAVNLVAAALIRARLKSRKGMLKGRVAQRQ